MERMENFKDKVDRLVGEYIEELEEENKRLREDSKSLESAIGDVVRENRRLKEENIKLKAQIEKMSGIGLVSAAPTVILDD